MYVENLFNTFVFSHLEWSQLKPDIGEKVCQNHLYDVWRTRERTEIVV